MEKEALMGVINEWMRRYLPHSTRIRIFRKYVDVLADMLIEHIVKEAGKK